MDGLVETKWHIHNQIVHFSWEDENTISAACFILEKYHFFYSNYQKNIFHMNVKCVINFLGEWMSIWASNFRKLPTPCVRCNLILFSDIPVVRFRYVREVLRIWLNQIVRYSLVKGLRTFFWLHINLWLKCKFWLMPFVFLTCTEHISYPTQAVLFVLDLWCEWSWLLCMIDGIDALQVQRTLINQVLH